MGNLNVIAQHCTGPHIDARSQAINTLDKLSTPTWTMVEALKRIRNNSEKCNGLIILKKPSANDFDETKNFNNNTNVHKSSPTENSDASSSGSGVAGKQRKFSIYDNLKGEYHPYRDEYSSLIVLADCFFILFNENYFALQNKFHGSTENDNLPLEHLQDFAVKEPEIQFQILLTRHFAESANRVNHISPLYQALRVSYFRSAVVRDFKDFLLSAMECVMLYAEVNKHLLELSDRERKEFLLDAISGESDQMAYWRASGMSFKNGSVSSQNFGGGGGDGGGVLGEEVVEMRRADDDDEPVE